jgi:hypothetical protein
VIAVVQEVEHLPTGISPGESVALAYVRFPYALCTLHLVRMEPWVPRIIAKALYRLKHRSRVLRVLGSKSRHAPSAPTRAGCKVTGEVKITGL